MDEQFEEEKEISETSEPDQIVPSVMITAETDEEPSKKFDIEDLKSVLPKPKPAKSKLLRKILDSKKSVHPRDLISGPSKPTPIYKPLDRSVFQYPDDLELFSTLVMRAAWREDERLQRVGKNVKEKMSFRGYLNKDVLDRLKVDDPPPDSRLFIQDIDPDYMNHIEGRPFGEKNVPVGVYIETAREVLRTKIALGYREDDIMLLDANIATEQNMLAIIQNNYQQYVDIFEDFLSKDNASAKTLLSKVEKMDTELYNLNQQHKKIEKRAYKLYRERYIDLKKNGEKVNYNESFYIILAHFTGDCNTRRTVLNKVWLYIKDRITSHRSDSRLHPERCTLAEHVYRLVIKCFLMIFKYYTKKSDDTSEAESVFMELLDQRPSTEELTIDEVLRFVKNECRTEETLDMYFTDPQEILDIFDYMGSQNLNYLMHTEDLAVPLIVIKHGLKRAEALLNAEIERLNSMVERLTADIIWEENRVNLLEEMANNLINGDFKNLIAGEDVLNLYCFVEDCYESRVARNDAGYDMLQMMEAIEEKYSSELACLNLVPSKLVYMLETKAIKEEMWMMKLAEKAAQQFSELSNMFRSINRAYAAPFQKPNFRPLMFRSHPIKEYKPPPPPPRELTEKEMDYLEHFTDFCKYTDDPNDFGIQTKQTISEKPEEDHVEEVEEEKVIEEEKEQEDVRYIILPKRSRGKGSK